MSGIDLSDPEVIRAFRRRLASFVGVASHALGDAAAQVQAVRDWLWAEQQPYWKRQVRIRQEAHEEARRTWIEAEAAVEAGRRGRGPGRASSTEERIALDRARRARDAAEDKLTEVQRWILRLAQEGEPLAHECRGHELALGERGIQALRELDRLSERVLDYLALPTASAAPTREAPVRPSTECGGGAVPCAS